jgi:membrane-associated phospholipid phosphatase
VTLVLLEVDGFHVPTDIAGGLLLALLLILAARAAGRETR